MEDLLKADREFAKMSLELGAAEAFKTYFVNDGVMLPNNQNAVFGVAAIYESMKMGEGEKLIWDPKGAKVDSANEMGYTWGTYTIILADGKKIPGKYLNVWQKQSDGKWKVIADMGNSSPN